MGKYLKDCCQGKLGQVLVALLADCLPRKVDDKGWGIVVGDMSVC